MSREPKGKAALPHVPTVRVAVAGGDRIPSGAVAGWRFRRQRDAAQEHSRAADGV